MNAPQTFVAQPTSGHVNSLRFRGVARIANYAGLGLIAHSCKDKLLAIGHNQFLILVRPK